MAGVVDQLVVTLEDLRAETRGHVRVLGDCERDIQRLLRRAGEPGGAASRQRVAAAERALVAVRRAREALADAPRRISDDLRHRVPKATYGGRGGVELGRPLEAAALVPTLLSGASARALIVGGVGSAAGVAAGWYATASGHGGQRSGLARMTAALLKGVVGATVVRERRRSRGRPGTDRPPRVIRAVRAFLHAHRQQAQRPVSRWAWARAYDVVYDWTDPRIAPSMAVASAGTALTGLALGLLGSPVAGAALGAFVARRAIGHAGWVLVETRRRAAHGGSR